MCKCSLSPHSAMSAYSHFSCLHCWYSSVVAFLCVAEEKTCFLFCLVSEQQLYMCCDSSQLMLFTRAILYHMRELPQKLPQSIVNSQQVQVRNKRYTTLISTLQRLDYIIHRITREHQMVTYRRGEELAISLDPHRAEPWTRSNKEWFSRWSMQPSESNTKQVFC